MSPVCKMADNGRLTVDQNVKVVLFYAETKSVVVTERRFRAHFGIRWAPCRQTIYRLSLGTIFQSMRVNSVPDVKWFCNNKNVLCTINGMTFHVPPCTFIIKYNKFIGCFGISAWVCFLWPLSRDVSQIALLMMFCGIFFIKMTLKMFNFGEVPVI